MASDDEETVEWDHVEVHDDNKVEETSATESEQSPPDLGVSVSDTSQAGEYFGP